MRQFALNNPTDAVPCWWEETKISTHLRHAAGICVLTTGLLIGSASGAIAAADTESAGSTAAGPGADESSQSVSKTSTPTTTVAETSAQPTHPTLLRDVIRKLQELGKPRTRPVLVTEAPAVPAAPDTKTDSNEPPDATPAAAESGGSDSTVVAPNRIRPSSKPTAPASSRRTPTDPRPPPARRRPPWRRSWSSP